ncbi:MAG: ABC transporter ATP-binding protein [Xanthobacteraceae bacterium]
MAESLLTIENLTKRFGALVATDGVSLAIEPGEVHAMIGPNGAGKTTLVRQISGELRPNGGRIFFEGREITPLPTHRRTHLGLVRSFQITSIFPDLSALDNVALAVQVHQGHSFHFWRDAREERCLRAPARAMLEQVGLIARAAVTAADMSHGEHRQLEIAMALASEPKMLLLDEPMAGMGPDESQRMVELLRGLKGKVTILLVEHDMDAVFVLADRITVLVYGRAIATGRPEEIRANKEVRRAYLGDGGGG